MKMFLSMWKLFYVHKGDPKEILGGKNQDKRTFDRDDMDEFLNFFLSKRIILGSRARFENMQKVFNGAIANVPKETVGFRQFKASRKP